PPDPSVPEPNPLSGDTAPAASIAPIADTSSEEKDPAPSSPPPYRRRRNRRRIPRIARRNQLRRALPHKLMNRRRNHRQPHRPGRRVVPHHKLRGTPMHVNQRLPRPNRRRPQRPAPNRQTSRLIDKPMPLTSSAVNHSLIRRVIPSVIQKTLAK